MGPPGAVWLRVGTEGVLCPFLQLSLLDNLFLGTGDLEGFRRQSFVLKEGVEYRIKISFRVRRRGCGRCWGAVGLESLAELGLASLPAGEPGDRVWHEVHPTHV